MPPRKAKTEEAEDATRPKHQQERVTEGQVPVLERPTYEPISEADRVKLNLWQRRARIIDEIGNVPKRGYNAFHKYHYALEADVTAYLGPLLAKYMVVIDVSVMLPTVITVPGEGGLVQTINRPGVERLAASERGDSKMMLTRLPLLITVINADEPGERVEVVWYGEGADAGDKGIYKAYTGALKFFYMKWFLIATGDDPEAFERVDQLAAGGSSNTGVKVESSQRRQPEKGGRQKEVTDVQIRSLSAMARAVFGEDVEESERITRTAVLIDIELGSELTPALQDLEPEPMRVKFIEMVKGRTGEEIGKVLFKMGQQAQEKKADEAAEEAADEAADAGATAHEGYGS